MDDESSVAEKLIDYWLRSSQGTRAERCHQLCERVWALLSLSAVAETAGIAEQLWNIVDFSELCTLTGRYGVTGIPTNFDLGGILDAHGRKNIPEE